MNLNYFNFRPFRDKILLTNDFGDYIFLSPQEFKGFVAGRIDDQSDLGRALISKRMAYSGSGLSFTADNRYHLRDAKGYLGTATSLHIFVVTTACNMKCVYCQASNPATPSHLVMDEVTAEGAVDIALGSPAVSLTFEFQGGEPLQNFNVIRHIVEYAEQNKGFHHIEYSIVSNLTLLTDEILAFLAEYHFGLSTSLDGPTIVHNGNRPMSNGTGSYDALMRGIAKARHHGIHIGAIETTTKLSLDYPTEIVHTYADLGFDSIFIRPLTPLGRASSCWDAIGYTAEKFVSFYEKVFSEIIKINKSGMFLKESHAAIFLERIFGYNVNYMELRSPCGAGVGQLAYYADGTIFTCDEARMLHEMGQDAFLLGRVGENSYRDLISSSVCKAACSASIMESLPSCCDCVYLPYCGVCPVVNYANSGDIIVKEPKGYRCRIYSGMLDCLFSRFYENDDDTMRILKAWSD